MAELSRPLPLDRVDARGLEVTVEASAAECAALTRRFAIPAVETLTCRFRLRRAAPGIVDADGTLQARVVRTSVVTLEDFAQDVAEAFGLRFVPAGQETDDDDPDAPDEVAYTGAALDLGEAAAEQLALALDPYPREPGASFPESESDGDPAAAPLAALARLRPQ
jgi:uncharacterized metal-binding protein YceD (DUF177 family)